ncbi:MAG: hypothetical protein AB8B56_00460 [Crocinitomicaceae bacterium]
MSSNEELKDIIQDHFDNVDVGMEEAWRNDMSDRLDAFNKRKRRGVIFFFTIGLLLFSSITLGAYFFSGKSEVPVHLAKKTDNKASDLKKQSVKNEKKFLDVERADDNLNLNESTRSNTQSINNDLSDARIKNNDQNQDDILVQKGTSSSSLKTDHNTTDTNSEDMAVDLGETKVETEPSDLIRLKESNSSNMAGDATSQIQNDILAQKGISTSQKTDLNTSDLTNKDVSVDLGEAKDETVSSDTNLTKESGSSDVAGNTTQSNPNLSNAQVDGNSAPDLDTLNPKKLIESENPPDIETIALSESQLDSLNAETNTFSSIDSVETRSLAQTDSINLIKDETKTPSLWEIGVLGGVSYDFRSFSSNSQSPYFEERINNEQMNLGWSGSIEIARNIGRLQLITGISYQRISETIDYDVVDFESSEVTEIYIDNSYWEYDSIMQQGVWYYFDSVYIQNIDTVSQTTITSVIDSSGLPANGVNSFQYFQVPLRFGFPIYHLPKLKIDGYIGGSIGFLAQKRGNYLLDGGGITLAEVKKVTFNSLFSIRVKYQFMEKMSIGLEPYVRVGHGNHSPIMGVKRRYTSFGMNVGLFFSL